MYVSIGTFCEYYNILIDLNILIGKLSIWSHKTKMSISNMWLPFNKFVDIIIIIRIRNV